MRCHVLANCSRVLRYALVMTLALVCSSCKAPAESDAAAQNANIDSDRPVAIRAAQTRQIGAICPLETVNGVPVRDAPEIRAHRMATFTGWSTIADPVQPAPPLVYLILRPLGAAGAKDVYLEMGRMPRPDLANGDARREMAGFEGQQLLPDAGSYDILVSLGTREWQTVCRSGATLEIKN